MTFLASDRASYVTGAVLPVDGGVTRLLLEGDPPPARVSGAVLLVAVVIVAAMFSSGDYLYVPNGAHAVADKVDVEGATDPAGGGGIYYVDVTVERATWLERLVPFIRPEGASLVPAHAVTAPGDVQAAARGGTGGDGSVGADRRCRRSSRRGPWRRGDPRGVLVESVAVDVPAARTLESGDVIVEAAGREVLTTDALRRAVGSLAPGDEVPLRLRRDGKVLQRKVRTVSDPGNDERAIIGIRVSQDAAIDLPVDVEIDLGGVGGPSAGLPFALEIYQAVGNDVDHGYDVAATGEIELDGRVASVGAIKQKTYGVRSAGADVFLVPAGENAATARRYAGSLRIIPVESFQQALRALQTLPQK